MNDLCIVEVENDVFDVNRYDTALIKLAAAQEIKCNLFCNQIQVNLDNNCYNITYTYGIILGYDFIN